MFAGGLDHAVCQEKIRRKLHNRAAAPCRSVHDRRVFLIKFSFLELDLENRFLGSMD